MSTQRKAGFQVSAVTDGCGWSMYVMAAGSLSASLRPVRHDPGRRGRLCVVMSCVAVVGDECVPGSWRRCVWPWGLTVTATASVLETDTRTRSQSRCEHCVRDTVGCGRTRSVIWCLREGEETCVTRPGRLVDEPATDGQVDAGALRLGPTLDRQASVSARIDSGCPSRVSVAMAARAASSTGSSTVASCLSDHGDIRRRCWRREGMVVVVGSRTRAFPFRLTLSDRVTVASRRRGRRLTRADLRAVSP